MIEYGNRYIVENKYIIISHCNLKILAMHFVEHKNKNYLKLIMINITY